MGSTLQSCCSSDPDINGGDLRRRSLETEPITHLQEYDESKEYEVKGPVFKACTWNMLAQAFTKPKWFSYVEQQYLDWNPHRGELFFHKVLDDLIMNNSDILSFQEVDCFDEFQDFFDQRKKPEFGCIFQKRNIKPDGLVIAYNKAKFELTLPYYRIDFDGLSAVNDNNPYFLTHNIALIVILKYKDTGQRVLVANTHCTYTAEHSLRQLLQIDCLLNCIKWLQTDDDLIVLNGDFNCTPESLSYQYITEGHAKLENVEMDEEETRKMAEKNKDFVPYINQDSNCVALENNDIIDMFQVIDADKANDLELSHKLKLKSAYKTSYGKEPEVTNNTATFHDCLDYIFIKDWQDLVGVNKLDVQKDNQEFIPSKDWPSDHYYLHAAMILKLGNSMRLLPGESGHLFV